MNEPCPWADFETLLRCVGSLNHPGKHRTPDGREFGDGQGMTVATRAGREGESQALPTANGHPDIQSAVIADIEKRREVGIARYGTALQPNNGRDALLDLYEELLDGLCYLKQFLIEQEMTAAGHREQLA